MLGYVHDLYKPIPGRFKDYISTPKPNGYQSLHTTVIGREGIPFEIQIRTDRDAQDGRIRRRGALEVQAGLWTRSGNEQAFRLDPPAARGRSRTPRPRTSSRHIKVDLFADEVFVFTPKGDVVNMPAGATPIDLAYAIHSAVGNRMAGAKINGRIAPIDTQLKNGDIVEILSPPRRRTARHATGSRSSRPPRRATRSSSGSRRSAARRISSSGQAEDLDRELRANLLYNGFYENEDSPE